MTKHEDRLPCCAYCHYCDAPLPRRHEHDHFPIPKAAGGEDTVPACMNCHEMKDRVPFEQWPPTFAANGLLELLGGLPTRVLTPPELVEFVGDHRCIWPQLSHAGRLLYAKTRAVVEQRRALDARRVGGAPSDLDKPLA